MKTATVNVLIQFDVDEGTLSEIQEILYRINGEIGRLDSNPMIFTNAVDTGDIEVATFDEDED